MAEEEKEKFILTTPEGSLEYKTRKGMIDRLEQEREHWEFLKELNVNTLTSNLQSTYRRINPQSCYYSFGEIINEFKGPSTQVNAGGDAFHPFIPPISNSPQGSAAINFIGDDDIDMALNILAGTLFRRQGNTIDNIVRQLNRIDIFQVTTSMAIATHLELNEKLKIDKQIKGKINSAVAHCQSVADNCTELFERANAAFDEQTRKFEEQRNSKANEVDVQINEASDRWNAFVEKTRTDWQKLRRSYEEQLKFDETVILWEKRQKTHKDNARRALKWFYAGTALFAVAIIIGIYCGHDWLITMLAPPGCDPADKNTVCTGISTTGIFTTALFTLVTSLILWMLRFQMKAHLSERHLALDAQERTAFVKTYLAFQMDKHIDENDKAIILASLFRPTQDGIIKDDSSLDTSPAGIITGILARNKS